MPRNAFEKVSGEKNGKLKNKYKYKNSRPIRRKTRLGP